MLERVQRFRKYNMDKHSQRFPTFTVILSLKTAIQTFCTTLRLMMMHHITKFGGKRFSVSEDMEQTVILTKIIETLTVSLTLKTATLTFCMTLRVMMMHHHTKFCCISSSKTLSTITQRWSRGFKTPSLATVTVKVQIGIN